MTTSNNPLWEILVPTHLNDGTEIAVLAHNVWDAKVEKLAGGLTILRSARGVWTDPHSKKTFDEKMIPVRIACDGLVMRQIADMTKKFYDQKAVMYYLVSSEVWIV